MEHKGYKRTGLADLPTELWLEVMRQSDWTKAMAICMACKYIYKSLRRYMQCPNIKIIGLENPLHPPVSLTIKHGRIYYFSIYLRRDRVFQTIEDMARFTAEVDKITSYQLPLPLKPSKTQYRTTIIKNGEIITWERKDLRAQAIVNCAMLRLNFGSRISQTPGNFISIKFGEEGPRKKLRLYRGRRRRVFNGAFEIELLLDADGNFEWKAPPSYDYRTIYAKKVYEDLKEVITSNRTHLKKVEVPDWLQAEVMTKEKRCTAYFMATYTDKKGLVYSVQRCIIHDGPQRVADLQNHKDKVLKSIIDILSRVLYHPTSFSSRWLAQLGSCKGRPCLPWYKLFKPPSPCPNESLYGGDFSHY